MQPQSHSNCGHKQLILFELSLCFTTGVQYLVCIFYSVCILPLVCSLQSAVCILHWPDFQSFEIFNIIFFSSEILKLTFQALAIISSDEGLMPEIVALETLHIIN